MKLFWSPLSLALPITAALLGIAILLLSRGGTGDYAARLGGAVLFLVGMAIACTLGAAAATISLFRAEPLPWLAAIALIGNLLVIVPIFRLLVSE
jgi:hypothetical protein